MQRVAYRMPTKRYQAKTKVNTIQQALLTYASTFSPYLILGYNTPMQDIYMGGMRYLSSSR